MPIVYEGPGDLLESKCQTTVCCVNLVGVMGAGMAAEMKSAVEGLYEFYQHACKKRTIKIGKPIIYECKNQVQQILLFPTKYSWRNPSRYEWVEQSLLYIKDNYKEMNITNLALTALGCGCGGLNYDLVRNLMFKHLAELPIDIYIYVKKT